MYVATWPYLSIFLIVFCGHAMMVAIHLIHGLHIQKVRLSYGIKYQPNHENATCGHRTIERVRVLYAIIH